MEKNTSVQEDKKISYEQLSNFANQLSEQNRILYKKLEEANTDGIIKRLDVLFKILKLSSFFDISFIDKCAKEIQNIVEIPIEEGESDIPVDKDESNS